MVKAPDNLFGELNDRPWRFGVRTAILILRDGRPKEALAILEEMIAATESGQKLPKWDVLVRLQECWQEHQEEKR